MFWRGRLVCAKAHVPVPASVAVSFLALVCLFYRYSHKDRAPVSFEVGGSFELYRKVLLK